MGKTRGHGSRRGGYRGRGRGRGGGGGGDSDEDEVEPQRGLGGQNSTVGMLPPSDSDDEGSEKEKPAAAKPAKPQGQSSKVGQLPPSDSDEDEDSEEEESEDSEEPPMPEYLTQTAPKKKKEEEDEPDPEQIKKDMERLQLIKDRREKDRLKRIADEGWDRFAPITDDNKPPGHVPGDHPSRKHDDSD